MQKDRPLTVPYPPAVTRWPKAAPASDAVLAPPFRTDTAKVAPFTAQPISSTAKPSESWENMSEEGVVEAAFEEDVARAADGMSSDTVFPFQAFIIPEDASRVPTGLDAAQVEAVTQHTEQPDQDAKHDLADRLERLSRRLRSDDVSSLLENLARGDRFDHLIAPIIASYFSKKNG